MAKYVTDLGISNLDGLLELPEGASEPGRAFSWSDNVDQRISRLNEEDPTFVVNFLRQRKGISPEVAPQQPDWEVTALGLAPLYVDTGMDGGFDLLALVNGTYALLQLCRETSAKLGAMEAEELRRAGELNYLRDRQSKLKVQVEACEREIVAVQSKEQQLQSKNKELLGLLKGEKDEVAKLLAALASHGTQHRHEMRRKELELSRLKEKMSQHLMDKRDRRASMEILNSLGRADGRRATWKTGKSLSKKEEEMFHSLLAAQEKQLQDLMLENVELKQLLDHLHQDRGILQGEDRVAASPAKAGDRGLVLEGSHTSNVMQEQRTGTIRAQHGSLRSHEESLGAQTVAASSQGSEEECGDHIISGTDHDKEILKLKVEIEESQQLIAFQRQWFQEQLMAAANDDELPANLKGSYFLEEQQRLQEERETFQEQQRAFEVERRNFTEAAIRLGHERKQFEEERALLLKQHFLSTTAGLELGDPRRRQSAPLATQAAQQEDLPKPKPWTKATYTPYLKANTPTVLVRSRPLTPRTPSTVELFRTLTFILDNRATPTAQPSPHCNDQKESHKDTACQTESEDFWSISGDLLDRFLDSSF